MLRRRRAWHEPEPTGWSKALRGLLAAVVGIGLPVLLFVWIWGAVTPRPDEQPPPPSLGSASVDAPAGDLEGTWDLGPSSWVGYRMIEEVPRLGEDFEAVGRTTDVEGELRLDGATLVDGWVAADLRGLESDNERRDRAIRRRFLESDRFPEARFELREAVTLFDAPEPGEVVRTRVVGDLTLREVTRPVTADVEGRWDDEGLRVVGTLPVTLDDYGIRPPVLPGFRIVEEQGTIEFDLRFVPSEAG